MTTAGKILSGLVLLILASGSAYYWYIETHKQATGAVPVASTTSGSMRSNASVPGVAGAGDSMPAEMPGMDMSASSTKPVPTPGSVKLDTSI